MADSGLDLLFRLKAQNQASPVIHGLQGDVAKLGKTFGTEFSAIQSVTNSALGKVTQSLTNFSSQVPVVGKVVQGLTAELTNVSEGAAVAGSEFAAIAGPIGIAVVAVGALTVGVVKLGEALFSLAEFAGNSQGKLFDLSQQTGVSVETLAALESLAKTTGGSIEAVAASLGIFQKNLEAAQDPTTKQAEAFKQLGVDADNTEDALRQTLTALAKMPAGFHQTALALEVFGRGGKQFLAILKESHGNIDETVRRLNAMGLGLTDGAKKADDFNDQLIHLDEQLTGIKVTLGNEVIPVVIKVGEIVGKTIADNKDAIEALGVAVKALSFVLGSGLVGAVKTLDAVWAFHKPGLKVIVELYKDLAAAMQLVTNSVPKINPNAIPEIQLGGNQDTDKNKRDLAKLLLGAQDAANASSGLKPFSLQDIFGDKKKTGGADAGLQLLKQLQSELRNLEGATKAQTIAAELLDTKYKNLNPSIKEQILLTARLIDAKQSQADVDALLKAAQDDLKQKADSERESLNAFIEAQTRALQGERTALDDTEDFILRFENFTGAMDESLKSWLRFNALLIDLQKHLAQIPDQIREAAKAMAEAGPQFKEGIGTPSTDELNPLAPGIPEATKHVTTLQQAFDDLGKSIGNVIGASANFQTDFGDVIGGAVNDLAQGIGSLVENYVLLGETAPHALRKLLAATLAHLAAEASVKAIFQLAEGFAALFINPAEAAAHFTSAAIFGSIAGVAAVAGRSVAGDLFKPQQQGSDRGSSSQGIQTIETGRNQRPTPTVVTVIVKPDGSKFGEAITAHVVEDIGNGGRIREVIQTDGR